MLDLYSLTICRTQTKLLFSWASDPSILNNLEQLFSLDVSKPLAAQFKSNANDLNAYEVDLENKYYVRWERTQENEKTLKKARPIVDIIYSIKNADIDKI